MNILSIENARTDLINFLENSSSRRLKLKKISTFCELLVKHNSQSLIESYLIEFIPQYIDFLKGYSPLGISPGFTQNIVEVNEKLIDLSELTEFKEQLSHLNDRMKFKLNLLIKILEGGEIPQEDSKVLFPVIEESEDIKDSFNLGAIDSITIKIGIAKEKDKFIVVPGESERDKQLEHQIITSWQIAKAYCKKYVKKLHEYHEVIISFDQHLGLYRGESVGTALTVGFIEELLKQYNSQTVLKPIEGVAFTGGIIESGKVNKVSKEVVEKKVEIAFYSNCQTLAVPKDDEPFALYKLEELKNEFPLCNLNIVGIKDLNEILLRRDLVEIKKQKLVVRTGKFLLKNWAGVLFAIFLTMLLTYLFALDFEDNPVVIENKGTTLLIKNKNGKLLWTKKLFIDPDKSSGYKISNLACFIDINHDGINEVLICFEDLGSGEDDASRIACYDYKGNFIWDYVFKDKITTKIDVHSASYALKLAQLVGKNDNSVIYCYVSNNPLYPSSIFRLDSKTGSRIDKGLWNAGHIVNCLVGDFNNDKRNEVIAFGLNNGFSASIVFSVDVDSLSGQTPTTSDYTFTKLGSITLNSLVKIEPSDLSKLYNKRMSSPAGNSLLYAPEAEEFRFIISEGIETDSRMLHYRFDKNLIFLSVSAGNGYEEERDNLIREGKLSPPLTNTEEYGRMLRDKISYWENGKWVKREELN